MSNTLILTLGGFALLVVALMPTKKDEEDIYKYDEDASTYGRYEKVFYGENGEVYFREVAGDTSRICPQPAIEPEVVSEEPHMIYMNNIATNENIIDAEIVNDDELQQRVIENILFNK